jgi:hypothetical protein
MAMNQVSLNIRIAFCIFTLLKPDDRRPPTLARAPIALRSKPPFEFLSHQVFLCP